MVNNRSAPNAEWADWVQVAADHAAANGSRCCDTYRRAAKAIRLHPEQLLHPSEALAIKGVGKGVVSVLTTCLQNHCRTNDLPFPDEPLSQKNGSKRKRNRLNSGPSASQPRKRRDLELTAEERALDESSDSDEHASLSNGISVTQKVRVTQKNRVRRRDNDLTPSELALDQSDSSPQPAASVSKAKSKTTKTKKKAPVPKSYFPNRRTGCWGMLVALYILTVKQPGPFTKSEVIEHAEEYCDSSYVETGSRGGGAGNSGYYTAWNMKKLLAEGLTASAPGRPPKFKLTKAGFEVAEILAEKENCELKEFDKSNLPDGIFKIDLNIPEVGEEREEEASRSTQGLPQSQPSKPAKTTRKKDNLNHSQLHHVQKDRDAHSNYEDEPQEIIHEIVTNYRISLANNSSDVEEVIRPNPNPSQSLLPHRGPFEFWYLDRNGSRVKKLDEADSRMHPSTFETLYQVEFQKIQSTHPVRKSSIVDDPTLKPTLKFTDDGWMLIGWMYESKTIPNCPGFTQTSTNSSSSSAGACSAGRAELHDRGINPPPSLTSTITNSHPRLPSSSILNTNLGRTSTISDRTINIIDEDISVVRDQTLRRTCSGAGSMTPVGSFNSILSEGDDTSCDYSQQITDLLRPSNQHGSRNVSLASTMNGGMGSEAAIDCSGNESTNSNEIILDESNVQSEVRNQTQGNLFTRTPSNLSALDLTQTTTKVMTDTQPETQRSLSTTRRNASGVYLERTPSNLSEDTRPRLTIQDSEPRRLESLASQRTFVSLSRTSSNLSEKLSNPTKNTRENSETNTIEALPIQRSQSNLRRTCSNFSEKNFSQTSSTNCLSNEPEEWKAGTYDLCLILDHREVRSLTDREAMFNMCQTKANKLSEEDEDDDIQISVIQRALVLGDALWIAVNRVDKREVVLDSIVERKRLDDLCSSIKDNRFSEQKARLRRSGLRDPIYLVEDYNTHSNLESHGPMINTAKSEVMLLNDFQLELTPDWKASVDFLMRRTEILKELHKKIDLTLIPETEIEPTNYIKTINELRNREPSKYWVTTYKNYEILNNKSSNLTITELWARMVSCLSGMSAEKVNNFIQHWDTPVSFWDQVQAQQQHQQDNQSQNSLPWEWIDKKSLAVNQMNETPPISSSSSTSSTNGGTANNISIGPTLSKRIWELYTLDKY